MARAAKTFWWQIQGPFQAMPERVFADMVAMACTFWQRVCGLTFERSLAPTQPCHLNFMQGPLYPQPAELGACHLQGEDENGLQSAIIVLYVSPYWAFGRQPDRFDGVRIAAHEIGHVVLGPDHLPPGNIMAPAYEVQSRHPMLEDIRLAQKKWGPPERAVKITQETIIPGVA